MQVMIKTLVLLAVMLLSVSAGAAEQRDFKKIISSGELRVGVAIYSPWVMRSKAGQLIGSEIDMARRLAADMGIKPEIGLYEWKQLIPALESGDIDIIVSGMAIKPARALRVNFSRPYGDAGIGIATNTKLTEAFKSMGDLKRPTVKIGVITDTVSADVAKRMFSGATLKHYDTQHDMQQALIKGDLHAVVAANPLPKFLSLQFPNKIDTPLVKPLLSFKEGFAVKKGDPDFVNFLDAWIVSRTADAWIAGTRRYWHETLDWQEQ